MDDNISNPAEARLPAEVLRLSHNLEAHDVTLPKDSDGYRTREELLRELYGRFGKNAKMEQIYRWFQGVDETRETDWTKEAISALHDLPDRCPKEDGEWKRVDISTDDYWIWVKSEAEEEGFISQTELIKVYASPENVLEISAMFTEAVSTLLRRARYTFYSKAARICRNDPICFWVTEHDYPILEEFFENGRYTLTETLPFVAYHNGLGIGREAMSWTSQNGVQAILIATYLSMKDDAEDLDLEEMYSLMVKGWNRELGEDHPMQEEFGYENAQILMILLETIDAITSNASLDRNSLLLRGEGRLWRALKEGRSWTEVAVEYSRDS